MQPLKGVHYDQASPVKAAGQGPGGEEGQAGKEAHMTCQFYVKTKKIMKGGTEVGGSPFPQAIDMPQCGLGRKPVLSFGGMECAKTAYEGPCWVWVDEKGNEPDLEFHLHSQKPKNGS